MKINGNASECIAAIVLGLCLMLPGSSLAADTGGGIRTIAGDVTQGNEEYDRNAFHSLPNEGSAYVPDPLPAARPFKCLDPSTQEKENLGFEADSARVVIGGPAGQAVCDQTTITPADFTFLKYDWAGETAPANLSQPSHIFCSTTEPNLRADCLVYLLGGDVSCLYKVARIKAFMKPCTNKDADRAGPHAPRGPSMF